MASVRSTTISPWLPPRASDAEVHLFSTRAPECPYDEIALLTGYYDRTGRIPRYSVSDEEALAAMKAKARQMGGDAIAGLTDSDSRDHGPRRAIKGTVIHFRDESCRR
jgi:hypothetical protein